MGMIIDDLQAFEDEEQHTGAMGKPSDQSPLLTELRYIKFLSQRDTAAAKRMMPMSEKKEVTTRSQNLTGHLESVSRRRRRVSAVRAIIVNLVLFEDRDAWQTG